MTDSSPDDDFQVYEWIVSGLRKIRVKKQNEATVYLGVLPFSNLICINVRGVSVPKIDDVSWEILIWMFYFEWQTYHLCSNIFQTKTFPFWCETVKQWTFHASRVWKRPYLNPVLLQHMFDWLAIYSSKPRFMSLP